MRARRARGCDGNARGSDGRAFVLGLTGSSPLRAPPLRSAGVREHQRHHRHLRGCGECRPVLSLGRAVRLPLLPGDGPLLGGGGTERRWKEKNVVHGTTWLVSSRLLSARAPPGAAPSLSYPRAPAVYASKLASRPSSSPPSLLPPSAVKTAEVVGLHHCGHGCALLAARRRRRDVAQNAERRAEGEALRGVAQPRLLQPLVTPWHLAQIAAYSLLKRAAAPLVDAALAEAAAPPRLAEGAQMGPDVRIQ